MAPPSRAERQPTLAEQPCTPAARPVSDFTIGGANPPTSQPRADRRRQGRWWAALRPASLGRGRLEYGRAQHVREPPLVALGGPAALLHEAFVHVGCGQS